MSYTPKVALLALDTFIYHMGFVILETAWCCYGDRKGKRSLSPSPADRDIAIKVTCEQPSLLISVSGSFMDTVQTQTEIQASSGLSELPRLHQVLPRSLRQPILSRTHLWKVYGLPGIVNPHNNTMRQAQPLFQV